MLHFGRSIKCMRHSVRMHYQYILLLLGLMRLDFLFWFKSGDLGQVGCLFGLFAGVQSRVEQALPELLGFNWLFVSGCCLCLLFGLGAWFCIESDLARWLLLNKLLGFLVWLVPQQLLQVRLSHRVAQEVLLPHFFRCRDWCQEFGVDSLSLAFEAGWFFSTGFTAAVRS